MFSRVNIILMTITTWILCFSVLLLPLTKTWGQFGFEQQTYSCTVVESEVITTNTLTLKLALLYNLKL